MKYRNNQFGATALVLAGVAIFFAAENPVAAGDPIVFNGIVNGTIPADMGPPVPGSGGCVFDFYVTNEGSATELGNFTGRSNFKPNVCTGAYTGTFLWVGADGDSVSGIFFGQITPTATPGLFDNIETSIVTGGTGRFVGASSLQNCTGQVNFATSSFSIPFEGTLKLATPRLANVSSRGLVQTGNNVMIAGFILEGGKTSTDALIRALGPSLGGAGINGTLADPTLDLRDANGARVAFNNDWQDDATQAALITATGIPPQNARESAIVATLAAGPHTAIVAGKDGSTGVTLLEVYSLD